MTTGIHQSFLLPRITLMGLESQHRLPRCYREHNETKLLNLIMLEINTLTYEFVI